jgi:glycosyltransferase involved in cell wall biosynthesis
MTERSVLFVSTWETECGIASYTAQLRSSLDELGVPSEVFPIDRRTLNYCTAGDLHAHFAQVAEVARDHDLVHIQHEHGFFAGPYGYRVSTDVFGRLLGTLREQRGVVVTFHSHPVVPTWRGVSWRQGLRRNAAHLPWRMHIARRFNEGNAHAIAPSRVLRRTLRESGLRHDRVTYIPQGAPTFHDGLDVDRDAAKEALGFSRDDRIVVLFGFVTSHKGHNVALDAVPYLPRRYKMVFVGGPHPLANEPYYEALLTTMASDAALARRVRLTGYVPHAQVEQYLAAADVCIVPYLEAGLATSAAVPWALASGRPVVGTRIPALLEVEHEGECLRLVSPHAARELAAAIVEVDTDDELAKRLVTNARLYTEQIAWPVVAHRHVALYHAALDGRSGA